MVRIENAAYHMIEVNGIQMRAAVLGKGEPLLLLHGHPETHLMWHKVMPKLAERFTVVAAGTSEKRRCGQPRPDGDAA